MFQFTYILQVALSLDIDDGFGVKAADLQYYS